MEEMQAADTTMGRVLRAEPGRLSPWKLMSWGGERGWKSEREERRRRQRPCPRIVFTETPTFWGLRERRTGRQQGLRRSQEKSGVSGRRFSGEKGRPALRKLNSLRHTHCIVHTGGSW